MAFIFAFIFDFDLFQESGLDPQQMAVGAAFLAALKYRRPAPCREQFRAPRIFVHAAFHGQDGAGPKCVSLCAVHPDVESAGPAVSAVGQRPHCEVSPRLYRSVRVVERGGDHLLDEICRAHHGTSVDPSPAVVPGSDDATGLTDSTPLHFTSLQVPVQRRPADADDFGDIGQLHSVFPHSLCLCEFRRCHRGRPLVQPRGLASGGETDLSPFTDEVAFDYVDKIWKSR